MTWSRGLLWRPGDLSKPHFGLAPEVYQRLAHELDMVVHNGALVNHAFSYQQLFEPNVLGTAEVVISQCVLTCCALWPTAWHSTIIV